MKKEKNTPIAAAPSREESFQQDITKAAEMILAAMMQWGGIDANDANFKDTAERVGRAYREILGGIFDDGYQLSSLLSAQFPAKTREMIVVGPIHVWSMCPHHLLPVELDVWVGYLPDFKVLGLSKLARVAELMAKRPGLQEDVTTKIAEALYLKLHSKGAGCLIRGRHLCMAMRGVKNGAITTTTQLLGDFLRPEVRAEFLAAVRSDTKNGNV